MAKYMNPIPYLDQAKEFEMRIKVELDTVTEVDQAKEIVADYILGLSRTEIIKALSCKMFPVYPEN